MTKRTSRSPVAQASGSEFFHMGKHAHIFWLFLPFINYVSECNFTVSDTDMQILAINNYHQKRLREFVWKLADVCIPEEISSPHMDFQMERSGGNSLIEAAEFP